MSIRSARRRFARLKPPDAAVAARIESLVHGQQAIVLRALGGDDAMRHAEMEPAAVAPRGVKRRAGFQPLIVGFTTEPAACRLELREPAKAAPRPQRAVAPVACEAEVEARHGH